MSGFSIPRPARFSALCLSGLLFVACGGDAADEAGAGSAAPEAAATAAAQPTATATATKTPNTAARPAAPAAPVLPAGVELPPADPILGAPLVINGEIIPFEVVRRQVIVGERGRIALELKKLELMTNQEIKRRIAEGASPEEFGVSDTEVQTAIDETKQQLREQYPDEEVSLSEILPAGEDGLPNRVLLTKVFLKTFLPDVNPEEYPATTLAALNSSEQSKVLFEALKNEWAAKEKGEPVESNAMFRQMIFQSLQGYLVETSDVDEGPGLPDDVLVRINGEDIKVGDIWKVIAPSVSIADVRMAKQWIVNMRLLRENLADVWLSDEEEAAAYKAHSDPYKDSMFSVERVATMVKRYPTEQAYKEFRRVYDAYQRRIASELTPDKLQAFADERTKQLIGQSEVDVDIILISAYDFKAQRWIENGWQEATKRTKKVLRQLVKEKKDWDDVLEANSDFYDKPIPANYLGQLPPQKAKGRFRGMNRNGLMQQIEESEYWQFLNGKTIADFIFFEQKPGTIANPIRGPYGWYIPRLLRRNISPALVNISDDQLVSMAEQDYTLLHLSQYAQELIAQNQVYGLE